MDASWPTAPPASCGRSTCKLSREHTVAHAVPGLVVVAGGKYTTYRVMARDAVDEAVRALDEKVPASVTEDVPLVGADGFAALWSQRRLLAERSGLHAARIEHLLRRHGTLVHEVLALLDADPSLAQPLPGADDYLHVEAVYAVTHEGAATSTTSSPAAPAPRSSPGTAGSPRRRWWPG